MVSTLHNHLKNILPKEVLALYAKENKVSFQLVQKLYQAALSTVLLGFYGHRKDEVLYACLVEKTEDSLFYACFEKQDWKTVFESNNFQKLGDGFLDLIFTYKKARVVEMLSNELTVSNAVSREFLQLSVLVVLSYFRQKEVLFEEFSGMVENQKNGFLQQTPIGIKIMLGFQTFDTVGDYVETELEVAETGFVSNLYRFLFRGK